MVEQKNTYWTIVKEVERLHYGQRRYLCRCICGKEKILLDMDIKYNRSRSCGCMKNKLLNETIRQKKILCICPMCKKKHKQPMVWIGNGTPRVLCNYCKPLAANGIDPDLRYIFKKDKIVYVKEPDTPELVDIEPKELVVRL